MYKTVKIILGVASTLLMTGTAVANQPVNNVVNPAAQTEEVVTASYNVKNVEVKSAVVTPKRKMLIVKQALPGQNLATRTNTQGRFVIATDKSRDLMTVYKTVKHSTVMPNKFKN